MKDQYEFDVIIIGGGATGTGIARDLALRGAKVILLEKNDLSEGTTGRCHGLLHSGGRYVISDPIAAKECAQENQILKKIASHIIDPCKGYFVAFQEDDKEFRHNFPIKCKEANVPVKKIPVATFLKQEPACSSQISEVYEVNDAYIDPFLLTMYNALDAKKHGAIIKTYSEVTDLIIKNHQITGIRYWDKIEEKKHSIYGKITINATGPWASQLEKQMDLKSPLNIIPTMGSLVIINDRKVNSVINHLSYPSDGDIIVPSHQSVILGTTSIQIKPSEIDNPHATPEGLEKIRLLGSKLVPDLEDAKMLRYYSGVRPLVGKSKPTVQDRSKNSKKMKNNASRKFEVIDYEDQGYKGIITIFGGKVTTYRLMAEKVADLVCEKLHITVPCTTHKKVLPGADKPYTKEEIKTLLNVDTRIAFDMSTKWGSFIEEMSEICTDCLNTTRKLTDTSIICKCEKVSQEELHWVRNNLFVSRLNDYRRRTRQGMGRCQGQFCLFKLADLEAQWSSKHHSQIMIELKEALQERWKTKPLADPMIARQIKLSKYMYKLGGNL